MKKFFLKIGSLLKSLLFLRIGLLTYNIIPLLVFEISYKAVTVFCARPFLEWIFSRCMDFAGFQYVNDTNILEFLCCPISVVAIAGLIILAAVLSIIEISALIFIFEKSRRNQKVTMYSILLYSAKTAIRILIPKNFPIYFYLLILSPILHIGVSSSFFSQIDVPAVLFDSLGNSALTCGIGLGLLAIFAFLAFRWIYCLQYFCLENNTAFNAYRHSAKLNRSHRILNFLSMICIQLVITWINNLFLWISKYVTDLAYNSLSFDNAISEFLGFGVAVVFFALYVIVYSLFMPLSCLKVCGLYYSNKQASGESFDNIEIPIEKLPDKKNIIDKFKEASKRRIAGVGVVFILVLGAVCVGVEYIISDIFINSQNQVETKIITSERYSLSPDMKTLLDNAKSSGVDSFMAEVNISSDGVVYCISHKSLTMYLETYDFVKEEHTYLDTLNFAKENFITEQFNVENCFARIYDVLAYADKIELPIIVDSSNIHKQDSDKIIANSILEAGTDKSVAWCSSNIESLRFSKNYHQSIPTIYKMTFGRGNFSELKDSVDSIMIDQSFLTRHQVNNLHSDGFKVIGWRFNGGKNEIQEATNYGIDYIYVATAIKAKQALETNQGLKNVNDAFGRYAFITLFKDLL